MLLIFLIVFRFAIILFISGSSSGSSSTSSSPPELLKTICDQTANATFCEQTLKSDPRTSTTFDVLTLSKIAYELATNDSINSMDYISGLANDLKTKPNLKPALKQCVTDYDLVTNCFHIAHGELAAAPQSANYDTLIAGDHVDDCEKALASTKVKVDPEVAAKFQITRNFINIGDKLTSILWDRSPPLSN